LNATRSPGAGPVTSIEELALRQRIADAIVVASLDVDSVLNDTDYELQQRMSSCVVAGMAQRASSAVHCVAQTMASNDSRLPAAEGARSFPPRI